MDEKNQNQIDKSRVVVGLDIGSSKIGVFIGMVEDDSQVRVLGYGVNELKKGAINELESTVHSLETAVKQAETMTGIDVKDVYVGIAGSHIKSINCIGTVPLTRSGNEVTLADMHAVVEQASSIPLTADREVIHVLQGDYSVDEQKCIKNPLGMSGVRLSTEIQMVTAQMGAIQNIRKSVERAGFSIASLVLEPLASACAILHDDERELGVAVIDIGAGSTDVAVFVGDTVRYTVSLDLAGNTVTNDIAYCFKTPLDRAEEIKKKYGTCNISNLLDDETIPVPGVGGRGEKEVPRKLLAQIIYERMNEILTLVDKDLRKAKLEKVIGAGVVITGGASAVEGLVELAEKAFNMPVRRGVPKQSVGLGESLAMPAYSTGVGLLCYAAKDKRNTKRETGANKIVGSVGNAISRFWNFIKNYI